MQQKNGSCFCNHSVCFYLSIGDLRLSMLKVINEQSLLIPVILLCVHGGLNRYGPHRLMCLNAWPIGRGTIRRCGFVEGSVSLW